MDFQLTPKKLDPDTTFPPKFTINGTLIRHRDNPPPAPVMGNFKECLKNHAASMGGHALDGCGEFMPAPPFSPTAVILTDHTSLKCAACGCHRNFHRREVDDRSAFFNLQHLQLPSPVPLRVSGVPISPQSPPEKTYHSSAPHMLLALKSGSSAPFDHHHHHNHINNPDENNSTVVRKSGKKRARTKFSNEQKQKMYGFSEKMGWKMSNKNGVDGEKSVNEFCNEIGISKSVLKVWMHNNKNTFTKIKFNNNSNCKTNHNNKTHHDDDNDGDDQIRVSTNGSSVSS